MDVFNSFLETLVKVLYWINRNSKNRGLIDSMDVHRKICPRANEQN